jgi:16S rRNA (guanine527-N7)-methyltransferase
MLPDRIAELLEPFLTNPRHSEPAQGGGEEPASLPAASRSPVSLSADQLHSISMYIDILLRWNARINLTAIRDPAAIVTRHFGEGLFAAQYLFPRRAHVASIAVEGAGIPHAAVADLGSGAGFPGIPIKLWSPQISLTLIESNQKKATFLREIVRSLALKDVSVQSVRGETIAKGQFDLVTLRAVERFDSALPLAAGLVAPRGRFALLIGESQLTRAQSTITQFRWADPIPIPQSAARILAVARRGE